MDIKSWVGLLIIVGTWITSGAVAFTTVRLSIKMLNKEVATNKDRIEKMEQDINKKLYDSDNLPIYMQRKECKIELEKRDRRRDDALRATCNKIEDIKKDVKFEVDRLIERQTILGNIVSNLVGRIDQYFSEVKK